MKRTALWGAAFSLSAVLLASVCGAAEKAAAKDGVYLAGIGAWSSIGGSFDGKRVLTGPDVILVPKYDLGRGWGVAWGSRLAESSVELSYVTTSHDVHFQGASGTARYNVINLDYKRHFFQRSSVQPHLLLGWVPYAWTTIKDASATRGGRVGNATLSALATGLNAGAGLTVYPHPRLFLSATAMYRWILFSQALGAADEGGELGKNLNGSGPSYVAQVGVTF